MRRAEGGVKIFGVFRVKNNDFMPKNHIFPNFRGVHPPPGSTLIAVWEFQPISFRLSLTMEINNLNMFDVFDHRRNRFSFLYQEKQILLPLPVHYNLSPLSIVKFSNSRLEKYIVYGNPLLAARESLFTYLKHIYSE